MIQGYSKLRFICYGPMFVAWTEFVSLDIYKKYQIWKEFMSRIVQSLADIWKVSQSLKPLKYNKEKLVQFIGLVLIH